MPVNSVLLLREIDMHPHSYLDKLCSSFEKPSVINIKTEEGLKQYTSKPIFDDNYLVIFDSLKRLESNLPWLHLEFMLPVLNCASRSTVSDAEFLLKAKALPYSVFYNEFTKEQAEELVRSLTKEELSASFCEVLIRRVGLNPKRLISAVMVCEQVGFTVANISKYIDKYSYIDLHDVIEVLLGICKSKAQRARASLFLHVNRQWYMTHTRKLLLEEVDFLIETYKDLLEGKLTSYSLVSYLEGSKVPRYKVLYAVDLYEQIGLDKLLVLKEFLTKASLLEVALQLK